MSQEHPERQKPKKISNMHALAWLVGAVSLLTGIVILFSQAIAAIFWLIAAALLLPPVSAFIEKKWHRAMSRNQRIVGAFIFIVIAGVVSAAQSTNTAPSAASVVNTTPPVGVTATSSEPIATTPKPVTAQVAKSASVPVAHASTPTPTPAPQATSQNTAPVSTETVSQENAVAKAMDYLNYTAFSYQGLIDQLEYDQFSTADATYGADNSGADWNAQAAAKAKDYMGYSSFSRGSLIAQLEYDKFTQAQAEYGANAVGL